MLSSIFKTAIRRTAAPRLLLRVPQRFYYPNGQIMQREEGEYYNDPVMVAERVVRLVALHDNVRDPAAVTLNSSFD